MLGVLFFSREWDQSHLVFLHCLVDRQNLECLVDQLVRLHLVFLECLADRQNLECLVAQLDRLHLYALWTLRNKELQYCVYIGAQVQNAGGCRRSNGNSRCDGNCTNNINIAASCYAIELGLYRS